MNQKAILQYNKKEFITDLNRVQSVVLFANLSGLHTRITKSQITKAAESVMICYQIRNDFYHKEQLTMVVL